MSNRIIFYSFIFLLLGGGYGCNKMEDEGLIGGTNPISRLYVSTSDYEANATGAINRNLYVIDRSDSTLLDAPATQVTTGALGGSVVLFSPFASRIFQSGFNSEVYPDTTIQILSINQTGAITPTGTMGNRRFGQISGMAYNNLDDQLFFANDHQDEGAHIFIVNGPKSGSGFRKPSYEVPLNYKPWAMQLDSLDLYVSISGANGGVAIYKTFVDRLNANVDTVVHFSPTHTLTVNGSSNIQGMSFSKASDILVLTDYNDAETEGRLLIFENFSSMKNTTSTISPTRIIAGVSTLLLKPTSVAVDGRRGARFIYVADAKSRLILRFKMEDNGNVVPDSQRQLGTVTDGNSPVSISLDARGIPKVY